MSVETPDDRLRKMREARARKANATSPKQTDGIEPEHFEVTLTDGRVIRW